MRQQAIERWQAIANGGESLIPKVLRKCIEEDVVPLQHRIHRPADALPDPRRDARQQDVAEDDGVGLEFDEEVREFIDRRGLGTSLAFEHCQRQVAKLGIVVPCREP